jgi:AcrR family transcriptional regulator
VRRLGRDRRPGLDGALSTWIRNHFSSKDELFAAIAEQVVADAEAFMRPALDAATGARETLSAVIRATVAFMAAHLDEMRALQQIILNGGHAWNEPTPSR